MRTSKTFGSLVMLPGGYAQLTSTLREFLAWLDTAERTTIEALTEWVQTTYNVKASTANVYVRVIAVLDLIRKTRSGEVEITRFGQMLLHADDITIRDALITLLQASYEGFGAILSLIATSSKPMTLEDVAQRLEKQYPKWSSLAVYREKVLWMRALDLVEGVGTAEVYQATSLGKAVATGQLGGVENVVMSEVEWLTGELFEAAMDGENSERFELLVKQGFERLGFNAEHIGGRGNTDVLLTNPYQGFRAIVDSKARADRLNQIDPYTLKEHREKHNAPLAMVIAPQFGGGRILRQAESHRITLLPVALLADWIRWHDELPFSIALNVEMFKAHGLIEQMPTAFIRQRQYQQRMSKLMLDIIRLLERSSASNFGIKWNRDNLHSSLVIQTGQPYTPQQVEQALTLLQHPTVRAVKDEPNGTLHLVMKWETFVARLSSLTQMLSQFDNEIPMA